MLADEINRASPKTQSALLEVMEEQKVTVDGATYDVPQPFSVIATQNPVEQLGTYKLPEAQMDRFLIKTTIGYPSHESSVDILRQINIVIATQNPVEQLGTYKLPEAQMDRFLIKTTIGYPSHESSVDILRQINIGDRATHVSPVATGADVLAMRTLAQSVHIDDAIYDTHVSPVATGADVLAMRTLAQSVHIDDAIYEYIVRLVESTRHHESIAVGSSMRGALALTLCARVWAAADNRGYVIPDDVKALAVPVLAHRVLLTSEALFTALTAEQVVAQILEEVPAPAQGAGARPPRAAHVRSAVHGADRRAGGGADPRGSARARAIRRTLTPHTTIHESSTMTDSAARALRRRAFQQRAARPPRAAHVRSAVHGADRRAGGGADPRGSARARAIRRTLTPHTTIHESSTMTDSAARALRRRAFQQRARRARRRAQRALTAYISPLGWATIACAAICLPLFATLGWHEMLAAGLVCSAARALRRRAFQQRARRARRRAQRALTAYISPLGWATIACAAICLTPFATLGWHEMLAAGLVCVAMLLAALVVSLGNTSVHGSIDLSQRRVNVHDAVHVQVTVENPGATPTASTRADRPMGDEHERFGIRMLASRQSKRTTVSFTAIQRAVLPIGTLMIR